MSRKKVKTLTKADLENYKKEFFDYLDQVLKERMGEIGTSTAEKVSKVLRAELTVFMNFMARVEAKIDAQSRMLYFIAKNRLSKKELREMAMISKTIRGEEELKN